MTRIGLALFAAMLAFSPPGTESATAAGRAAGGSFGGFGGAGGGLGLTKQMCDFLGGDVDDFGNGEWSCCADDACWNCRGEMDGPAPKHCDCYGDGCDASAARLKARRPLLTGPKSGLGLDRTVVRPEVRRPASVERPDAVERLREREAESARIRAKAADRRETGILDNPRRRVTTMAGKRTGSTGAGFKDGAACTVVSGPNRGEKGTFDEGYCCDEKDWGCTDCTNTQGRSNGKCKAARSALRRPTSVFDDLRADDRSRLRR